MLQYMKSKKGITPIIAVILLLMMTVAGAGAAFFWFVRIQSEMQGGTESYSEQLTEKISARVDISEMDWDSTYNELTIIVRNNGNMPISLLNSTTTMVLKDHNNNILCNARLNGTVDSTVETNCAACSGTLSIKATKQLVLNMSNSSGPCYISPTTYANGTLMTIRIDFNGITATGGTFTT